MPAVTNLLDTYHRKRNFDATPEPRGAPGQRGETLSFVIQKHAASHLHYDFRLELDGTLKSWAIPKGPSLDPADKRMAVHVEDHPLDYAGFEGVIPKGHYGAGTVIVWDRGTWEPIGDARASYRAGKLKFRLHGEKLHGGFTLVRMHGRQSDRQAPWLLIKERDDQAVPAAAFSIVDELPDSVLTPAVKKAATRPAKPAAKRAAAKKSATTKASAKSIGPLPDGARKAHLPLSLSPQLATLVREAPHGDDWIYEIKFDGYRILARIDGDDLRLFTRNGHDWTSKLKPLAAELRALKLPSGWLDGEIIVTGADGGQDFNALQNAFDEGRTDAIQYYVFDLPFHAGHDLRDCRLDGRRALLADLLRDAPGERVRFSEAFDTPPDDLLQTACRLHLEGVIGKRRDAPYASRRSGDWIKLKCTQRQEFVIVGYTDPKGSRQGIGSLMLGLHDHAGHLRYAGNVGTGFDAKALVALERQLSALKASRSPLHETPAAARGHWVKPKLVAEVSFAQWTPEGRIRHSVFHGLRSDKPPRAITQEVAQDAPSQVAAKKAAAKKTAAKKTAAKKTAAKKAAARKSAARTAVRVTHPERVVDASTGLTKQDVVDYYIAAARHLLPHLDDRPVALVRAPAGIAGHLFFQKHAGSLKVDAIRQLDPAFDPGHPPLMEIDSFEALIGAAQMNVIELHTWNARTAAIDQPDRMTFDLDPGEGVEWAQVIEAAELTHALLDELGLKSFLKTSGGKGLHVVVPITPEHGWDAVKGFSKQVVEHLARVLPARFVAKSGPRNRVGKIFVDYLRNGRGATTVSAFSLRSRPGMGVSIPCSWDELYTLGSGAHWTLRTAPERLEADVDPWAGYARVKQSLTQAMERLASI